MQGTYKAPKIAGRLVLLALTVGVWIFVGRLIF